MLLRTIASATLIASAAAAAPSRAVYFEGGRNVRASSLGADWQLADDSFCARELARYIFLTTGDYPALVDAMEEPTALEHALTDSQHDAILLVSPGSRLLDLAVKLSGAEHVRVAADGMDASAEVGHHAIHRLHGLKNAPESALMTMIVGAGEFGRLYGVYSSAEQLGVRFQLTGDILPDPTSTGGLPLAGVARLPFAERDYASPMFDFRGLQP
jgi:hypothetical protein